MPPRHTSSRPPRSPAATTSRLAGNRHLITPQTRFTSKSSTLLPCFNRQPCDVCVRVQRGVGLEGRGIALRWSAINDYQPVFYLLRVRGQSGINRCRRRWCAGGGGGRDSAARPADGDDHVMTAIKLPTTTHAHALMSHSSGCSSTAMLPSMTITGMARPLTFSPLTSLKQFTIS